MYVEAGIEQVQDVRKRGIKRKRVSGRVTRKK